MDAPTPACRPESIPLHVYVEAMATWRLNGCLVMLGEVLGHASTDDIDVTYKFVSRHRADFPREFARRHGARGGQTVKGDFAPRPWSMAEKELLLSLHLVQGVTDNTELADGLAGAHPRRGAETVGAKLYKLLRQRGLQRVRSANTPSRRAAGGMTPFGGRPSVNGISRASRLSSALAPVPRAAEAPAPHEPEAEQVAAHERELA